MNAALASPPSLAPAGAGLPPVELFAARLFFHTRRRVTTSAAVEAKICSERVRIERLVATRNERALLQRVLIPRPRGLEDSSRHWSLLMALDHLRIVNHGIAATIRLLLANRVPPGTVSTASVKPSQDVGLEVIAEFVASCVDLSEAGTATRSLTTSLRHAHPWFGPLDAKAWKFLGAFHLGLHRRQMETILHYLPSGGAT